MAPNIVVGLPDRDPCVGMTSIGFLTASTAIVQTEAAPEMRGRVLALQAMVFLGSTPIGGPIVGCVAEHAGPRGGRSASAVLAGVGAAAWGRLACPGSPTARPPCRARTWPCPVPETA